MRFDKTRENAHIALHKFLVNPDIITGGCGSDQDMGIFIIGVILHDPVGVEHL